MHAVLILLATTASEPNVERDQPTRGEDDGVEIGVLGGVGFPRPLAIEGVVGVNRVLMFGAEYSFLPKTTIASVDARLWAAAAGLRVFPFKGAFFVGLRGGFQHLGAEATISAANIGSYSEAVDVDTWFVNPRIGFLWRWKALAVGIDAGVQIPLGSSVTRSTSTTLTGLDVDARVTSAADALGRTVLPTIDLLRLGLVF